MLITTTKDLSRFCKTLSTADFVTIDTEFLRERTYWPQLCLVQVAGPDEAKAIDPLAEGIDLRPLYDLLENPKVLKVFHAARQDVEIFYNATGKVPAPMFDTQVAAMVCGFGEAASYETLALKLVKTKIDKSSRFTNWSHRPLTERQIRYAIADVTHLREIYIKLAEQLEQSGRSEWMQEEMEVLTNPTTYRLDPDDAWRRLKLRTDKPQLRAIARELAAWREHEAQRLNIPRGRVIRDETLMEIVHHAPQTIRDLAHTRGLPHGFAEGREGKEILAAIARAKSMPLEKDIIDGHKHEKPKVQNAVCDMLKVLLKKISEEHGVAAKLIASSGDIERLAAEDDPDIPAMYGWRRRLFGETALALKRGELALCLKEGKVELVKFSGRKY